MNIQNENYHNATRRAAVVNFDKPRGTEVPPYYPKEVLNIVAGICAKMHELRADSKHTRSRSEKTLHSLYSTRRPSQGYCGGWGTWFEVAWNGGARFELWLVDYQPQGREMEEVKLKGFSNLAETVVIAIEASENIKHVDSFGVARLPYGRLRQEIAKHGFIPKRKFHA